MASIGDLPAIFGYDFNRWFNIHLPIALQTVQVGGIITICNHMEFPTTNSYHYSYIQKLIPDPVQEVLSEGSYHQDFLDELDRIANFAKMLKINGNLVSIMFRPWYENTGGWFCWGGRDLY